MTDDAFDAVPEIIAAARIVARKWEGVIEADVVEQEIWIRILEADYFDRVSEMDKPARGSVLRRIGNQVASRERDDYEVFSGQVVYGTDEVRSLLTCGLLDRNRDQLDTTGETFTEWLDLHEAAELLRDADNQHADVIGRRYLLGERVEDTKSITRAIDALTREMNRVNRRRHGEHSDGPGSRTPTANGTALAVTGREWGGTS